VQNCTITDPENLNSYSCVTNCQINDFQYPIGVLSAGISKDSSYIFLPTFDFSVEGVTNTEIKYYSISSCRLTDSFKSNPMSDAKIVGDWIYFSQPIQQQIVVVDQFVDPFQGDLGYVLRLNSDYVKNWPPYVGDPDKFHPVKVHSRSNFPNLIFIEDSQLILIVQVAYGAAYYQSSIAL
jgi:hypothetical protein